MANNGQTGAFPKPRAHPRWPTEMEVRYGTQEIVTGRARDISEGGIGFTGAMRYPVGSDIEISFRHGAPVEWFRARGVVRHSGPEYMGAEFVGMGMLDRTRILEMIYQDIAVRRR